MEEPLAVPLVEPITEEPVTEEPVTEEPVEEEPLTTEPPVESSFFSYYQPFVIGFLTGTLVSMFRTSLVLKRPFFI